MCLETKEIAAPACSCLDSTILTWLCVAGLAFLLRLDEQGVSFRLPMPHAWMLAFARVLMSGLALLSDASAALLYLLIYTDYMCRNLSAHDCVHPIFPSCLHSG